MTDSPLTIRIDGCRCKDISFQELLEMSDVLGKDIDLIALSTGASIECGTCRPWLERALDEDMPCFEVPYDGSELTEKLLAHFGEGRCPAKG